MKAVHGELPTDDDQWAFEVKWDGHRTLVFVADGEVRLQSANLLDVTARYPELAGLAASVNASSAVIDGEVVVLDAQGVPRFELLQRHATPALYVAFDLLALNGAATTTLPFEARRRLLEQVLEPGDHWVVTPSLIGGGADLLEAARDQGLEGVMAKRLGSPYQPGKRSPSWRKVKLRREQEVVVGGWTMGEGNRASSFGALLVGVYEGEHLRYAGAVGTGFDQRLLGELAATLEQLRTSACPFEPVPPAAVRRVASWAEPRLVAQVAFAEWTADGLLRQPSFLGLRDDKDPREVVREPS